MFCASGFDKAAGWKSGVTGAPWMSCAVAKDKASDPTENKACHFMAFVISSKECWHEELAAPLQ